MDFSQNPRELTKKHWIIFTAIFTEVVLGNTEVDLDGIKIAKYIHAILIYLISSEKTSFTLIRLPRERADFVL